jgi:hypothetical protein
MPGWGIPKEAGLEFPKRGLISEEIHNIAIGKG